MLHNIDVELSEILSVYQHFQNLAVRFDLDKYDHWLREVGRSLYVKGGCACWALVPCPAG
jgi:hypothetical protein